MKNDSKLKYILAFGFGLSACIALGHDVAVHRAITYNAIESALAGSPAYTSFLNVVSPNDIAMADATNAMILGSALEDAPQLGIPRDAGGDRSINHFYDPLDTTYGKGLSDFPPDIRFVYTTNSFIWGSVSNSLGLNVGGLIDNVNTTNQWSWQNARGYEWLGLTATNKSDRFMYLTNMFRAVGQVMHLLEDLSQPQHVRNEQHLDYFPYTSIGEINFSGIPSPWQSPIENWGFDNVGKLNYQQSMLDWNGAGFTKLEDFWDRHLYNGDPTVLDAAENGGAQLGLAEWCNGNFLGARHLYPEYYDEYNPDETKNIRWYPYPSRDHSTDYLQRRAQLNTAVHTLTLKNGQQVQAIYLAKTNDGVQMDYHSRFTYFGGKFPYFGMITINDNNVLSNYHNIFIPKAVEYSAGLLDYFFRGTMDVSVGWDTNTDEYTFTNLNTSTQDFMGGSFYLFKQTTDGCRTLAQQYPLSGILPAGSSTNVTYPGPATNGTTFYMVYQGTIGQTGGSALDPVDANIGIAAAQAWVEQTTTNTYDVLLSDLGLTNGSTITTNLESDEFPFPLASGEYKVIVQLAYFDDKGSIGSIQSIGPSTSCDWGNEISNTVVPVGDISIDPDDNTRLSVNISATDDPVCGLGIGWSYVIITWLVPVPTE